MQRQIDSTYLSNIERNKLEVKRLYEKALDAGIVLPNDFVEKYDGSIYGSKYFHSYITMDENNKKYINENSWKDSNVFYREYMSNPSTQFFVDMNDCLPDFEKAVEIVHNAGGIVFLPHIYEYRENSIKILDYILSNYKFEGVECYYRNFTKEQTDFLLKICKENSYYVSGGSDYHGYVKPGVEMGTGEGSLNVPDDIVEKWKKVVI